MRNNAFTICLTTFVVGIFGFFLRWLQTLNGFDEEGLAIPGAATAVVYLVYSLLALCVFVFIAHVYLRKKSLSDKAAEALYVDNFIPGALMWAVAVVMAVSCIVLMFSSDFARYPTMQRMMSALGIFSALCLPFVLRRKAGSEDGGVGGIAAVIPVLFGCLWLITAYRIESENPVLWSCALEILAIVASTLSFYYVAAYFYGRAKPARGIVMLQAAVYLCMCTLMDNHSGAEKVLFGCLAAAFLVLEYVLLSNVKEKEEKEEK